MSQFRALIGAALIQLKTLVHGLIRFGIGKVHKRVMHLHRQCIEAELVLYSIPYDEFLCS